MRTPVGAIGVVGVLVATSAETWSVRRRDGSVAEVELGTIEAARIVPPSAAQRATAAEVEQAAALGWRGLETARLGEWLLRAGAGFTSRANSAMAVGDPGTPLAAAVDAVQEWYAERGLPPRAAVAEGAAPGGLEDELRRRRWDADQPTHVMTAEITHVLRAVPQVEALPLAGLDAGEAFGGVALQLDDAPDDAWLAAYRAATGPLPPAARDVLVNHPNVGFASLRSGETGEEAAVARAAVDG
ncbi:MAG TPA: hypothetical protein VG708_14280, partial [Mycobacteriales bacterium]|nr:hypothetical protein [Mycobacteriales bacterium]